MPMSSCCVDAVIEGEEPWMGKSMTRNGNGVDWGWRMLFYPIHAPIINPILVHIPM
ncbi:hypothetical protein TIFTF001_025111 [Ficus carica]|uniref:Uncharacterized protein n=1 Tax=Ficus carica TaxID=3494 RepID=A0AA88AJ75_FICCA|nr:hypothetical protein TIFTF001_025111 [Ficus carica]